MTQAPTPVEVVTRYVDRVWNARDYESMAELLAEGYRRHLGPDAAPLDRDGQRKRIASFHDAFDEFEMDLRDIFGCDDRVTFRFFLRGRHHRPFRGVPASGNTIAVEGIDVVRVEGGRMVDHWGVFDRVTLFRQMGADIG